MPALVFCTQANLSKKRDGCSILQKIRRGLQWVGNALSTHYHERGNPANKRPSHYNDCNSSVLILANKYAKTMANITWSKFEARLHRLYEQKKTDDNCQTILGEYVRRWQRWTTAGLTTIACIEHSHITLKTPHDGGTDNSYKHVNILFSSVFPSCYPEYHKT